jgi:hypothetical protein
MKTRFQILLFQIQLVPLRQGGAGISRLHFGADGLPAERDSAAGDEPAARRQPAAAAEPAAIARHDDDRQHQGGEVRVLINRSACQVKPFYLSSQTVLRIKSNRSTFQVKPFCLSSETVLPFKRNSYRYTKVGANYNGLGFFYVEEMDAAGLCTLNYF